MYQHIFNDSHANDVTCLYKHSSVGSALFTLLNCLQLSIIRLDRFRLLVDIRITNHVRVP